MAEQPDVSLGDWVTIGKRDAVVCHVYSEPGSHGEQVEVVHLDERNRATNNDVKWADDHWEFATDSLGGYAGHYDRLASYVQQLRRGRWRSSG